ncbi:hypothetical protein AMK68_02170 [candidate division KD3-62 bacterium DG_56]|uniref:Copper amine oxidase-like N-terminal domain-containing protein n=1 Tax=candidate division KD3-62 bacterium DG_56 TaxID=1704032 RepID=A0A0S7XP45_9BACT|nr:MAG: hypothetical protein AMK68_02170 [candidate division KD3-62 bacterium DG_56]
MWRTLLAALALATSASLVTAQTGRPDSPAQPTTELPADAPSALREAERDLELAREACDRKDRAACGDHLERALRLLSPSPPVAPEVAREMDALRNGAVERMCELIRHYPSDLPGRDERLALADRVMAAHPSGPRAFQVADDLAYTYEVVGRLDKAGEWKLRAVDAIRQPRDSGGHVDLLQDAMYLFLRAKQYPRALEILGRLRQVVTDKPDDFVQPYADQVLARWEADIRRRQAGRPLTSGRQIAVTVNDVPLVMDPAPKLVDGTVVAPVRAVAETFDASVYWNPHDAKVSLWRPERWTVHDPEPMHGGSTSPYDLITVGAVATLRAALSDRQLNSLDSRLPRSEPVLARFEITDGFDRSFDTPFADGSLSMGFAIRAILYWVYFEPNEPVPRGAAREVVHRTADGKLIGTSHLGPWPAKVRIETVEYVLTPKDVGERRQIAAGSEVIMGAAGWEIDEKHTKVLSTNTVEVGEANSEVAVFDLSLEKVRPISPGFPRSRVTPHQEPGDLAALEQQMRQHLEKSMAEANELEDTLVGRWLTDLDAGYSYSFRDGLQKIR